MSEGGTHAPAPNALVAGLRQRSGHRHHCAVHRPAARGNLPKAVTAPLTAAGFSVVRMTARSGQPVLTATEYINVRHFPQTYVMAIAKLRPNEHGREEIANPSTFLMWATLWTWPHGRTKDEKSGSPDLCFHIN